MLYSPVLHFNGKKIQIELLANNEDPNQTAPTGAIWSGSALFVQTYLPQNWWPLL